MKKYIVLGFALFSINIFAQQDTAEVEDFSMYADMDASPSKTYCTSKIIGNAPSKLVSLGFDFEGPYNINVDNGIVSLNDDVAYNYGLRGSANFPVISNTKWLVNLGVNYLDHKYIFKNPSALSNAFTQSLSETGLRSMGANYTIFKPLNEKHFLLHQSNFDLNGDYSFTNFQSVSTVKFQTAVLFGWKKHDRRQFAVGATRTYRGGESLIIPVVLYNYTFQNRKWGIEALLPARAAVRYTINSRNIILGGFELEGASYYLGNMLKNNATIPYSQLELRRSELRNRITYEFSVYKFIWMSVQVGYIYNYKFKVDDGGELPVLTNKLSSPFYANVSINLVSP